MEGKVKNNILDEVEVEIFSQNARWGTQDHCPFKWLSILMEEVGEASRGANDAFNFSNQTFNREKLFHDKEREHDSYRKELIQVAAVAVQMIACLDRDNW